MPAQASQPSVLPQVRPYEPEQSQEQDTPVREAHDKSPQMSWVDVMNELRSVQQSCGQLRTQVEDVANNVDTSHIVASQEALSQGSAKLRRA